MEILVYSLLWVKAGFISSAVRFGWKGPSGEGFQATKWAVKLRAPAVEIQSVAILAVAWLKSSLL